jgi:hypothetical protein
LSALTNTATKALDGTNVEQKNRRERQQASLPSSVHWNSICLPVADDGCDLDVSFDADRQLELQI